MNITNSFVFPQTQFSQLWIFTKYHNSLCRGLCYSDFKCLSNKWL